MSDTRNMEVIEALPLCKQCGGDLDRNDPQGAICTICGRYEDACTCDPAEVVGPDPYVEE